MPRERKLRPSGEPYSPDPKTRHSQLVADGKIGGKGSEDLARAFGKLGGRPRRGRPVDLPPELRDVLLGNAALGPLLLEHERDAERLRERADRLRRLANGMR